MYGDHFFTDGLTRCSNRIVIATLSWKLEVKCLEQREPFSDLHKDTARASSSLPLTSTGAGWIQLGVSVTMILLREKVLKTVDNKQLQSCD